MGYILSKGVLTIHRERAGSILLVRDATDYDSAAIPPFCATTPILNDSLCVPMKPQHSFPLAFRQWQHQNRSSMTHAQTVTRRFRGYVTRPLGSELHSIRILSFSASISPDHTRQLLPHVACKPFANLSQTSLLHAHTHRGADETRQCRRAPLSR